MRRYIVFALVLCSALLALIGCGASRQVTSREDPPTETLPTEALRSDGWELVVEKVRAAPISTGSHRPSDQEIREQILASSTQGGVGMPDYPCQDDHIHEKSWLSVAGQYSLFESLDYEKSSIGFDTVVCFFALSPLQDSDRVSVRLTMPDGSTSQRTRSFNELRAMTPSNGGMWLVTDANPGFLFKRVSHQRGDQIGIYSYELFINEQLIAEASLPVTLCDCPRVKATGMKRFITQDSVVAFDYTGFLPGEILNVAMVRVEAVSPTSSDRIVDRVFVWRLQADSRGELQDVLEFDTSIVPGNYELLIWSEQGENKAFCAVLDLLPRCRVDFWNSSTFFTVLPPDLIQEDGSQGTCQFHRTSASDLNIRATPAGDIIQIVPQNTLVEHRCAIVYRDGVTWARVVVDGQLGWASSKYLSWSYEDNP